MQQQGSNNILAQPIINLEGNVSVITLRSDRELPNPTDVGAKIDDSAKTNSAPKQIPLPFPSRSIPAKKVELDSDLETFRRVEVNIPLLDATKKIPKYAKFLKNWCTHKRKLKGNEQVKMGKNVSALIQSKHVAAIPPSTLPQKCKDPGTFIVPCTIGDYTFTDAILDLGASINVMPTSVYRSLHLSDLEPTSVVLYLAN